MKKLAGILVATFVAFASCNSDSDTIQGKELSKVMDKFQERVNNITVPSNLSNSENEHAQQANKFVNMLRAQGMSFSAYLNVPENASYRNSLTASRSEALISSKTYTWSLDSGTTINYTVSEAVDRYSFVYQVKSESSTATLMNGYSLKDGSYAELVMFDMEGNSTMGLKWWLTNDNAKLEIQAFDNSKLVMESNLKDNSGNVKIYDVDSELEYEYNWSSDGSGWYKNYIEDKTYNW